MENKDGRHSDMVMQLLRHVTSSACDADVKGDIFRPTIYSPSLAVIGFILGTLRYEDGTV